MHFKFYLNCFQGNSKGQTQRDKLKGTNSKGQTEPNSQFFLQIFTDFCRFSLFLGITAFRKRRFSQKPQETADFRRKPQETADFRRNRFVPFSLSLLIPPCVFRLTWILLITDVGVTLHKMLLDARCTAPFCFQVPDYITFMFQINYISCFKHYIT